MVRSSSVSAPEPEKMSENKVEPILWDTRYNYLYLQGMISKMRMTGGPDLLASANAFLEAQDPPQHVFEKRTVSKYLNAISTILDYLPLLH